MTTQPPLPIVTVTLNPAIDQTLSIPGFSAGTVNRVAAERSDAGGKGVNVASILADMGLEVIVTGFLGQENDSLFEALFIRKGIADHFVRIPGATRVGIKIVDERARQTTDINFPGLKPSPGEIEAFLRRVILLAEAERWFVLSGSVPAGAPDDLYERLINLVHARGGRVVLDTSGEPLRRALLAKPEVVKPNADELSELVGHRLDSMGALRGAADALLNQGVQRVVVSLGAEGALFVDREQAILTRPPTVTVSSTVGAGDAMVGGIVWGLVRELPLEELARLATASGAYAVTRVGAGIDDLAEHRRLMDRVHVEWLDRQGVSNT